MWVPVEADFFLRILIRLANVREHNPAGSVLHKHIGETTDCERQREMEWTEGGVQTQRSDENSPLL